MRWLGLFALLLTGYLQAAGFDCHKASTPREKQICGDGELSQLDSQLNRQYHTLYHALKDKHSVIKWQREWLSSYDLQQCHDVACLKRAYKKRIAELNRVEISATADAINGNYIRYVNGKPSYHDANIVLILLKHQQVVVDGYALWKSPGGSANLGDMHGIMPLTQGRIEFNHYGCQAEIQVQPQSLDVLHDDGCGGMNVSFQGHYRRQE